MVSLTRVANGWEAELDVVDEQTQKLVASGSLAYTSVGFKGTGANYILEGQKQVKVHSGWQLQEISIVPFPANPNAKIMNIGKSTNNNCNMSKPNKLQKSVDEDKPKEDVEKPADESTEPVKEDTASVNEPPAEPDDTS